MFRCVLSVSDSERLTICWRCSVVAGEFLDYFRHVTDLGFEDTPDYTHLKGLFRKVFTENKFTYDANLYDWEVIAAQRHPPRKSN